MLAGPWERRHSGQAKEIPAQYKAWVINDVSQPISAKPNFNSSVCERDGIRVSGQSVDFIGATVSFFLDVLPFRTCPTMRSLFGFCYFFPSAHCFVTSRSGFSIGVPSAWLFPRVLVSRIKKHLLASACPVSFCWRSRFWRCSRMCQLSQLVQAQVRYSELLAHTAESASLVILSISPRPKWLCYAHNVRNTSKSLVGELHEGKALNI